jgi:hypothetical protein
MIPSFSSIDSNASTVAFFLIAGGVLSLMAAALGSTRWTIVALFDGVAFIAIIVLLNLQELHSP